MDQADFFVIHFVNSTAPSQVSENPKVYAVTEPELLRTDFPQARWLWGLENPPRAGDFQIF